MKSKTNVQLGDNAYLVDFMEDYLLKPGQWHKVVLPVNLLNPQGLPFGWFDIGGVSGNGASTFYVDEIRLVAAEP